MVRCIAMYSVALHMRISTRIHKKYLHTSIHINTHNHSCRPSLHIYLHTCIKQTHTNTHVHQNLIIQTHNHTHVHWHIYIQTHISFNCWTAISSAWTSQFLWQFSNLEVHILITNARKASKGKAIDPHTTDAAANHVPKELFCLKSAVLGELHWSASRSSGSFDAPGRWPGSSGHGALWLYFRQI